MQGISHLISSFDYIYISVCVYTHTDIVHLKHPSGCTAPPYTPPPLTPPPVGFLLQGITPALLAASMP